LQEFAGRSVGEHRGVQLARLVEVSITYLTPFRLCSANRNVSLVRRDDGSQIGARLATSAEIQ
jgi:hypothetical protein